MTLPSFIGWMGDLVAQHILLDGIPQPQRRVWAFDSASVSIVDNPEDGTLEISFSGEGSGTSVTDEAVTLADASATITVAQGRSRIMPTVTAARTIDLSSEGASDGDVVRIQRTSLSQFDVTIRDLDTSTEIAVLPSNAMTSLWARFDGTEWVLYELTAQGVASGTSPGLQSIAHWALLDGATDEATPDTLALRGDGGECNFTTVRCASVDQIASNPLQIGGSNTTRLHLNSTEDIRFQDSESDVLIFNPRVIGANTLAWQSEVASVVWSYATRAGTGANAGGSVEISAQDGQASAGFDPRNAGGDIKYLAGSRGAGLGETGGSNGKVWLGNTADDGVSVFIDPDSNIATIDRVGAEGLTLSSDATVNVTAGSDIGLTAPAINLNGTVTSLDTSLITLGDGSFSTTGDSSIGPSSGTLAITGTTVEGSTSMTTPLLNVNDILFPAAETSPTISQTDNVSGTGADFKFRTQKGSSTNAPGDLYLGVDGGGSNTRMNVRVVTGSNSSATTHGKLSLHTDDSTEKLYIQGHYSGGFHFIHGVGSLYVESASSVDIRSNDSSVGVGCAQSTGIVTITGNGAEFTGQRSCAPNAVATTSGAVTVNANLGDFATVGEAASLTGAAAITISNMRDGTPMRVMVKDNGQTISWSGVTDGATVTAAAISTGLGSNVRAIVTVIKFGSVQYFYAVEYYAS